MKLILFLTFGLLKANGFEDRVVGGESASENQFPYQASIQVNGEHNCGGAIIHNKWILTAAHCVDKYSVDILSVSVGSIYLSQGTSYQVEDGFYHEDWDSVTVANDIGLLKTKTEMQLSSAVQLIPIANLPLNEGDVAIVSGWGFTNYPDGNVPNHLQYLKLHVIDLENCKKLMEPDAIFDNQICTLNKEGEGACKGDSGGPLVHNGQIKGIVSWGKPCAKGKPDIFISVPPFIDWINTVIMDNQ